MADHTKFSSLYLMGLILFFIGLGLLGFVLFLIPYAFFGVNYDVPAFIAVLKDYLQLHHHIYQHPIQMIVIMVPLIALGLIMLLMAVACNHTVEDEELNRPDMNVVTGYEEMISQQAPQPEYAAKERPRFSKLGLSRNSPFHPVIAILFLVLVVFAIVAGIEWFIFATY